MGDTETISVPRETITAAIEQGPCNMAERILKGDVVPIEQQKHKPAYICPYCDLAALLKE